MMCVNRSIVILYITIFSYTYAYKVVPGNSIKPDVTFTFPVAECIRRADGFMYISAAADGAGAFSIAALDVKLNIFKPLIEEKVVFNGQETVNPLFDKKVQFIGLLEQQKVGILAVPDDTSATVYFLDTPQTKELLSYEGVTDASGAVSSGIIALSGSNKSRAYVAVKPAEGIFGDSGSGINIIGTMPHTIKVGDKEETRIVLGALSHAVPFDTMSAALAIQHPLQKLVAPVSLVWSMVHEFLYIGVGNAIAGDQVGDGVRSIALGINDKVERNSLLIRSVFDILFDVSGLQNNTIIIAAQNEPLSVHHLATMVTSTGKVSLIVVGGNGAPNETRATVRAIPLVPFGDYKGLVANKYNTHERALTVAECVTNDDPQACVGGLVLPAGPIHSLSVRGDVVFVTVTEGDSAGVYSSRALFDACGEIKGWTEWTRASALTQPIFASSVEQVKGNHYMLIANDENQLPNTIVHTAWDGDDHSLAPVVSFVDQTFDIHGGMQAMYQFSPATPGFGPVSWLSIMGFGSIACVQTGIRLDNDVMIPTPSDTYNKAAIFHNGAIDHTPTDETIMYIDGGALQDIGPLTTVACAHSQELSDTWLVVAGTRGVAILQHTDGSGCGEQIGPNFSGFEHGMRFVPFGAYDFVRKLSADGEYLYILTDTHLDRVRLAADIQQSIVTTIARVGQTGLCNAQTIFTDCVISNSLALLATSSGLLSTAVGSRIIDPVPAWMCVAVPEGETPIVALYPVSSTGFEGDCARGVGGMISVLSGNAYNNLSLINRFAIVGQAEGESVKEDTVQPFWVDQFLSGKPSYFIDYGQAEDLYATDGAITLAVRNKQASNKTTIKIPYVKTPPLSGVRFIGVRSQLLSDVVQGNASVSALFPSNVSGSWLLASTMGMKVNE